MNNIYIPNTSDDLSQIQSGKDIIERVTYFSTLFFIFLVPWGDGLWDGTPRIAAMIALGFAILLLITRGTKRNYSIAHLFILLYFSWLLITVIWSPDQVYGIEMATTGIQLLFLVFLISIVMDRKQKVLNAYQAYVFGNIAGTSIIIYNFKNGIMSLYYGRYGIVNMETDSLSIILALAIPIAAYLISKQSSRILKIINLLAIPIILYAVLLTGSRTGSIVAGLGIMYWLFTYRKSSYIIKIFISFVIIASLIATISFAPKSLTERVSSSGKSISSGTLNGRTEIWRGSLKHWKDSPFIGTGVGGLGFVLSKEHLNYRAAHNTFIHILSVNGIIGLSFYLLVIFSLFQHISQMKTDEKAFLTALLVGVLVSQLTSHTQAEKFLWIFFSLIIAQSKTFASDTDMDKRP